MSYAAAIDQLFAMVPELYTQPGQQRRKFSLDEIAVLLEALGNPHRSFKSLLIAGTNGKGSTAATLASILQASAQLPKCHVGLYTSPHLERVNERIRVDANQISDDDFARHFSAVHEAATRLVTERKLMQMPSFFETLTSLAFLHFAESGVDIAVLEVGMGGRLDATNIVEPQLSVITDISLDHTEWLGNTIGEIAREKAGILRPHGTLITLPQHPAANQILGEVATALHVRAVSAVPYVAPEAMKANSVGAPCSVQIMGQRVLIDSPLTGAHQQRNIALAIAAAVDLAKRQVLEPCGFSITPESIERGIHWTNWPGRLERFYEPSGREWILDVAHNPAGAWALRAGLDKKNSANNTPSTKGRTLIFSCLRDKPLAEMAQILFPLFSQVILTPIHSLRAIPTEQLFVAAQSTGTQAVVALSVGDAIQQAKNSAEDVVIAGSAYLVGEARPLVRLLVGIGGPP